MTIRNLLIASTALSLLTCAGATAQQPPAPPQGPAANEQPQQHPPGQKKPPQAQPGKQSTPAQGQPSKQPATAQEQPRQPEHKQGEPKRDAQQPGKQPAAPGQPPKQPTAAQEQPKQPEHKQGEPKRDAQQPGKQPAAQGQPSKQPTTAQEQPKQREQKRDTHPQQPAQSKQPTTPTAQEKQERKQEQQRPAQAQPPQSPGQQPAARTQPAQPQPPAAQAAPTQPTPPAAQSQPAQPQAPTAQTPSAQPQAPTAQQQRPIPPAAQGQPVQLPGTTARRLDELRGQRHETREGNRVVIQEDDRTIIREGGRTIIRHNEVDRFRYGARDVRVERQGADTITVVERPNGTRIITVTDANGRLIRRTRRDPAGREIVIIDNPVVAAAAAASYFVDLPPPAVRIPRERYIVEAERASEADIYATLIAAPVERLQRRYTLDEIRYSPQLRDRMPRVDLDTINFESGSWEIPPDQAARLSVIAAAIKRAIQRNPGEVFLIEGHTDAVGSDDDNLSLSDRRAETVALVLTQQFQVPAENLTSQGYGEQYLKVQTDGPERQNRRVTMRRITPLLSGGAPQQPGG